MVKKRDGRYRVYDERGRLRWRGSLYKADPAFVDFDTTKSKTVPYVMDKRRTIPAGWRLEFETY